MARWRIVFFIAAGVYIACATFYNLFGSGIRQEWDNPSKDAPDGAIPIRQITGTNNSNGVQHVTAPSTNGQTQLNGNGVRESTQ